MYPKVKVRHDDDDAELGLKAFLSLYLKPSPSPVMDQKVVSTASIVKAPKCYVPVTIPRVLVTEEDSGDFSSVSDSSGATGSEKDDSTDENKVNIRASSIPRPRAVISSPENDMMIGNRNKNGDGRLSASKNGGVLENRHAHCKVKSHDVTDIPPDTRKQREPGSKDKADPVGKKKVHKGSVKFENAPWKF
ncbi:hypothetical protein AAZX31_20G186600 [Glycine max]|uniref:Uncharacterized protein n=3 Tax=Glycine subgen. Soja TaxID=1462606 RepID=I1NHZ3_SOYBN|nr:uncharacterized protein LOC100784229 [Glycine max]XP_028220053.1 uncharacterized protein LOC114401677 [Glycine soja]KAG4908289.1 hypothetical protein JHK86_056773 [Glycine max]KAG4910929.1 hypothetical protein JHK87_057045 [Glycine soja]KAG5075586.1 hypothetical protein JHK84_056817 [Glycine max]KAG5078242.1 hypothetical protein JHK82_056937 [Glycine max]KAH1037040.1 hypothetical protein GYH30_056452 [Glycine max]|eukprot:XP_003556341.1 uncharacterized protein LOC100784229 [Glycine max]